MTMGAGAARASRNCRIIMSREAWSKGPQECRPLDPPHGRPVFSLDVGQTILTGGSDHGIREYTLDGKYIRELFGKKYGHKEWVTTVVGLEDGRVLSGAMDSVVCLWEAKGVKCDHFLSHRGSISKVMGNARVGVSASYDATLIVWDLAHHKDARQLIGPHKEAVMTFDWEGSLLVSGDKKGLAAVWDLNAGLPLYVVKRHKGAISQLQLDRERGLLLTTGLNDGHLVISDLRSNETVFDKMVHTGSANCLAQDGTLLVTGSADHTLHLLDYRSGKPLAKVDTQEMVNGAILVHGLVAAVTDAGNLLVYNMDKCLYGFGVMQSGVCRDIMASGDRRRAVCVGEDAAGTLLAFD
jgi:WD40 repeat protein